MNVHTQCVCHAYYKITIVVILQEKNDKKTMFSKRKYKFKSKIQKIPLNTDKIL